MLDRVIESLPLLLVGAKNTITVSFVSMVIALPIAVLFALMRLSRARWGEKLALIYIEVWRGVPFVVELLVVYFMLPILVRKWFTLEVSAFEAMVVGCVLWTSANLAEVIRGAILAIPYGQTEAASALGMNYLQRMRLVILPQTIRSCLPPSIGIFTLMLKGTAIGFMIEYRELIRMGQITIERLFMQGHQSASIEIYTLIMIMYFVMIYPLSRLSLYLEKRFTLETLGE